MCCLPCENMACYEDDNDALGNNEDENVEYDDPWLLNRGFCTAHYILLNIPILYLYTHSGGSHPLDITTIVINNQQLLIVVLLTWRSSHDSSNMQQQ